METLRGIAAWWDGNRVRTEQIVSQKLGDWVAEDPSRTRVVLATVAHTAVMAPVAIGAALVDLLRLGEGVEKGTAGGFVEDSLRVLPLVGPAGRLLARGTGALKWVLTDPNLPNCGWVASTIALRMTNVRHFATLDDLYAAMNIKMGSYSGITLAEAATLLKQMGAATTVVAAHGGAQGVHVVAALAKILQRNPNSVVAFSVTWGGAGHMMVAALRQGKVIIVNRPGPAGRLRAVGSLDELESVHPGISGATMRPTAVVVKGAGVVTVPRPSDDAVLATAEAARVLGSLGVIALEIKAMPVDVIHEMPAVMF